MTADPPQALRALAQRVTDELRAAGFAPHAFTSGEYTGHDWRHSGPLVVIRRDHLEVWWSVGLRSADQPGPTRAEQRMTPILLDVLIDAEINAELSTPTRQGDIAVWVTP